MKKKIIALHLIIFCSIITNIRSSQRAPTDTFTLKEILKNNIIATLNREEFRRWYENETGIVLLDEQIEDAQSEYLRALSPFLHLEGSSVPPFDRLPTDFSDSETGTPGPIG
jgi:hypothetical protein